MQITHNTNNTTLEYYPIKNYNNTILPNQYLRVLTYDGITQTKRIINTQQLDEEVRDRVDNYNYSITGNKDNLPQFHSQYNV